MSGATEVNKALTAIRKQTRECAKSQTYRELFAQAELLQHMAFELKDMARTAAESGGRVGASWAQRSEYDFLKLQQQS